MKELTNKKIVIMPYTDGKEKKYNLKVDVYERDRKKSGSYTVQMFVPQIRLLFRDIKQTKDKIIVTPSNSILNSLLGMFSANNSTDGELVINICSLSEKPSSHLTISGLKANSVSFAGDVIIGRKNAEVSFSCSIFLI